MPKLAKLLETVKLFLFETYNKISGNSGCCSKKIKTEKQKTFNFFQCSTLWFSGAKIRLILTCLKHFCKDFWCKFGIFQKEHFYFQANLLFSYGKIVLLHRVIS